MDDVVDTGADEHQRANRKEGQCDEPGTLTKLLISLCSDKFRRATETFATAYIGAVAGKYQCDDRPSGDADKNVQGEAMTNYCWSGGKNDGKQLPRA